MRPGFIALKWKFSLILFFICFPLLGIVAYFEYDSDLEQVNGEISKQLNEVANLVSQTVRGEEIEYAYQTSDIKVANEAISQINTIYDIYNGSQNPLSISNLTIFTEEISGTRFFYRKPEPVTFLAPARRSEGAQQVGRTGQVVYKDQYDNIDGSDVLFSAFAPIHNVGGELVAIAQIDIYRSAIQAMIPSFMKKLLVYTLLALIIALGCGLILSILVTKPIDQYVDFVNKVSEGNYDLRLELLTRDEMEKIAHALNLMLEKIEGLIETEADRDRLQENITGLLKIVSAAADGDFTYSAEVTADTLGALADSFNLMVADLSTLIRDVKSSSDQIAKSTREILINTEAMSNGADSQAKEIEGTYRGAKEMAELLKYANVRTAQAAESARRAAQVAMGGTEVVKKSSEGMHRIRKTVQETAKRVRVLGQSSHQIGEIIEVISDIANRTNLLALNATIEAARAGDAGRGFAVVADEVRMLAERASKAAKDIGELIESIQAGTSDAVMAMERGTDEVEHGTLHVDEAGAALKEIIEMVQDSSQSITEISGAFQQQTKASSDIAEAMKRTASIAQETAKGARQSRKLAEQMETLSRMLNTAVSKFRLSKVSTNHKMKM